MNKKNKTDAVIHMTVKDDSDFLSVYSVTDTPVISSEVTDIVAWVFLWESVDIHVFRNHSLRRDVRRYEALENMQVEYEEDIQEP